MLQVVDIMRTNVEKVLDRDAKLSELDDRAGNCSLLSNNIRKYRLSISYVSDFDSNSL